jgi:hypothetical protein
MGWTGATADEKPIVCLGSNSRHWGLKTFRNFACANPINGLSFPQDMTETPPQNRRLAVHDTQSRSVPLCETIFQNVPEDDEDAAKQLKATLDHLANAAGLSSTRPLGF